MAMSKYYMAMSKYYFELRQRVGSSLLMMPAVAAVVRDQKGSLPEHWLAGLERT